MERNDTNPSSSPTGTATQRTQDVAQHAGDRATDVAQSAKERAGDVADEVRTQTANVAQQAKDQLHQQARSQTGEAASALRRISDQARALSEGRVDDAGQVRDYARQAAGKVSDFADRLQSRGFDGIVNDVESFARRRPGAFLVCAAGAGFLVGRLLRGATSGDGSTQSQQLQQASRTGASYGGYGHEYPTPYPEPSVGTSTGATGYLASPDDIDVRERDVTLPGRGTRGTY
ncbi:MAG TPA: hypothetical protein VFC33_03945 [Acidimicrobiia bacterium]|nr:hypothetical protein [Acidimicrobiia bacterium]